MRETIGLLGGSFNPIHNGHLAMAEAARKELNLDRLLLIPDGDPPHKAKGLAGKGHRLHMVERAAKGRFEVSAMEVERPGKTYTVDTLEVLHTLYPDAALYMIIGADTLRDLPTWRDAPRVFALCQFAVFARGDLPLAPVEGARVVRMETVIPDISATMIRKRVHQGYSLEGYTPPAVEDYIGRHRLYDPPVEMKEKNIRKRLKETLPPSRYRHSLGVEQTIMALAGRWGYADQRRAMLTGLLHDCAKGMSLPQMVKYVDTLGIYVDEARKASVALLHAAASMAMARATYGVTDPEILQAIRFHNTGSQAMQTLDKLLFVADMTEPGRKDMPWLQALRDTAADDLDAAVKQGMRIKLDYIASRGKEAHPDTAAAYAAIVQQSEGEGTA